MSFICVHDLILKNLIFLIQSRKLRDAYYQCDWYEMPTRYRKALIICTIRAQVPLRLTAGKIYIWSLNSFTDVSGKSIYDNIL